jgi:hypothetical protein
MRHDEVFVLTVDEMKAVSLAEGKSAEMLLAAML